VSERVSVTLQGIAKGGTCVARLDGRVVFVAGGIPGETVVIDITDSSHSSWWRGRVIDVIEPSPDRVLPPCPVAGRCGGCDWQHIGLARQRALKAELIAQQMRRLAGGEVRVTVEPVPGDSAGLAWRTRVRYLVGAGHVGFRAARSHDLVPLPSAGCALAVPGGPQPAELVRLASGAGEVGVTVSQDGASVWTPAAGVVSGAGVVRQVAAGRTYRVRADGFWQVHPGAADALVGAVMADLAPRPGVRVWDLYCGVGLFAGALAGAGAEVHGVEQDEAAVALARRNVPEATFSAGRVQGAPDAELVVLDPPRTGAGRSVLETVAAARPRVLAYVSCDEATLARDAATLSTSGYEMTGWRAFDIFPMTSHVECVARFELRDRDASSGHG